MASKETIGIIFLIFSLQRLCCSAPDCSRSSPSPDQSPALQLVRFTFVELFAGFPAITARSGGLPLSKFPFSDDPSEPRSCRLSGVVPVDLHG